MHYINNTPEVLFGGESHHKCKFREDSLRSNCIASSVSSETSNKAMRIKRDADGFWNRTIWKLMWLCSFPTYLTTMKMKVEKVEGDEVTEGKVET